VVLVGEKL
jgi:hypothetical protein